MDSNIAPPVFQVVIKKLLEVIEGYIFNYLIIIGFYNRFLLKEKRA